MTVAYGSIKPALNTIYNQIEGFMISRNATTPTTKLTISAGVCRDQSTTFDINLGDYKGTSASANANTVLDTAIVGAGGIDTGVLAASKLYNVYAIGDIKNGNLPTVVASLSYPDTGPLMPYGYNTYRRIGFAVTDAGTTFIDMEVAGTSNLRALYYLEEVTTSVTAGNATTNSAILLTNKVPSENGNIVDLEIIYTPASAANLGYVGIIGTTTYTFKVAGQVSAVPIYGQPQLAVRLSASSIPQVWYKVTNAGDAMAVNVRGFTYTL